MAFYQLHKKQFVPASADKVWEFISNPENLKVITPEYMDFVITSGNLPEKMYAGMIITYTVKPLLGLKMTWVTEITHIEEKRYFVDEQRSGPYSMWHHQHLIEPVEGGVMMTDIVSYKPPGGFLGAIANSLVIRHQLEGIFNYREEVLEKIFSRGGADLLL
ncbi:MAG: SRPBCC family protein [Bacteroidales bacterium]